MGCCFSTGEATKHADPPKPQTHQDRALSPEEETVKEVLVHSVSQKATSKAPPEPEQLLAEKQTVTVAEEKPQTGDRERTLEFSQASEICDSFTQSFSTATTATTGTTVDRKGEDEALSKPRAQARKRSQAAGLTTKRRCNGGDGGKDRISRSPARRTDQSPQPKPVPTKPRLVQGRGPSQLGPRKRNGGPTPVQRLSEEGKDFVRRRSRSPASRVSGTVSAGAGARRSPAKAGKRSVDEVKKEERRDGAEVRNEGGGAEEGGTESLENPLVSLECFIFL